MTEQDLIFGKRLDSNNDDKIALIDEIIKNNCKNVLDLGAGTCLLDFEISKHKIHVDAVDLNFKSNVFKIFDEVNEYINFYSEDIVDFVQNHSDKKYDCIILSAILHEIDPYKMLKLSKSLKNVMKHDECLVLIREPYYEMQSNKEPIKPFKSLYKQRKFWKEFSKYIPEEKITDFSGTFRKSYYCPPPPIWALNIAFTYSYGEASWAREKHEYRYAYSKQQLIEFINDVFDKKEVNITFKTYKKDYGKHFKDIGYPDWFIDSIEYTNCLIIAKGGII